MNVIIMGCGRVGARLAGALDSEGHKVTLLDVDPYSFRRIPADFNGNALIGSGTEEDSLIKAGIKQVDVFVAATRVENRNILAAQIAREIFNVPRVVCRIFDPMRQELYQELGLITSSPTILGAKALREAIGG